MILKRLIYGRHYSLPTDRWFQDGVIIERRRAELIETSHLRNLEDEWVARTSKDPIEQAAALNNIYVRYLFGLCGDERDGTATYLL